MGQLVIVAGQSLCVAPAGGSTTFAYKTFNPLGIRYRIRAVGGTHWDSTGFDLAGVAPIQVDPFAKAATSTTLIMCGGTTDIHNGDTAQQVYDDMVAYADARRAEGFGTIVNLTIPPNTANTGGQETVRQAANVLVLADAQDAFDIKVDLTGNANLEDEGNVTYYYDGVHWSEAATAIVAALLTAALP